MEELSNRFPHLASNILNEINDDSLLNCKESSREMNSFIVSEKFFWIRIIRNYKGNLVEFKESWKKTINKSSVDFVMELSQATYRFFTKKSSRFGKQWHPLFIVGDQECLQLFKCIFEKVDDKNPKGYEGISVLHLAVQEGCLNICKFILENVDDKQCLDDRGCTPLYKAAQSGHLEACKLLLNHLEDKNLGNNEGRSPLHTAALNGHLEVFKVVVDVVADKNPRSTCHFGGTPLHCAAQEGHLDICELIVKYAQDKNPIRVDGITPLHLASVNGHLKICKFLISKTFDKSPEDQFGRTPFHFAAKYGHLEVCKLFIEKASVKNTKDNFGDTPISLAKKNNHFETASFITKYLVPYDEQNQIEDPEGRFEQPISSFELFSKLLLTALTIRACCTLTFPGKWKFIPHSFAFLGYCILTNNRLILRKPR